jgi:hypothetical protein
MGLGPPSPTGRWEAVGRGGDDTADAPAVTERLLLMVTAGGRLSGLVDDGDGVFDDSDCHIHGSFVESTGSLIFDQVYASDGAITTWEARYDAHTDTLAGGTWTGAANGTFKAHRLGGLSAADGERLEQMQLAKEVSSRLERAKGLAKGRQHNGLEPGYLSTDRHAVAKSDEPDEPDEAVAAEPRDSEQARAPGKRRWRSPTLWRKLAIRSPPPRRPATRATPTPAKPAAQKPPAPDFVHAAGVTVGEELLPEPEPEPDPKPKPAPQLLAGSPTPARSPPSPTLLATAAVATVLDRRAELLVYPPPAPPSAAIGSQWVQNPRHGDPIPLDGRAESLVYPPSSSPPMDEGRRDSSLADFEEQERQGRLVRGGDEVVQRADSSEAARVLPPVVASEQPNARGISSDEHEESLQPGSGSSGGYEARGDRRQRSPPPPRGSRQPLEGRNPVMMATDSAAAAARGYRPSVELLARNPAADPGEEGPKEEQAAAAAAQLLPEPEPRIEYPGLAIEPPVEVEVRGWRSHDDDGAVSMNRSDGAASSASPSTGLAERRSPRSGAPSSLPDKGIGSQWVQTPRHGDPIPLAARQVTQVSHHERSSGARQPGSPGRRQLGERTVSVICVPCFD